MLFQKLKVRTLIILSLVSVIFASVPWAGEAWATRIISKNKILQVEFSDSDPHTVLARRFKLASRGRVAIFYSAECAVDSTTLSDRVVVRILVDGEVLGVTFGRNFCSSNGGTVLDGFAMYSQSAATILSAGRHRIVIQSQGQAIGLTESYWIADQNLTLIVEKN